MSDLKQYAERDAYELDVAGDYYSRHVCAMTAEALHSKSDIAAELAHRDMIIDQLRAQVADMQELCLTCGEVEEIKAQAVLPIFNKLQAAHGDTTHPRAKVYLCEEAYELAAEVILSRGGAA